MKKSEGFSFEEWKAGVSNVILDKEGLTADCLPNYLYRDDYDMNMSASRTATNAIVYSKEVV